MAIPTAPPDPNATVIFLNWFMSKEGQTVAVKSMGFASSRVDVPAAGVNPDVRLEARGTVYRSGLRGERPANKADA
ncbi:MAG: hypothetical protein HY673_26995 [Chloroflexi bacterium]|nr:hypothetical protein [Chloroflexota bacterium]